MPQIPNSSECPEHAFISAKELEILLYDISVLFESVKQLQVRVISYMDSMQKCPALQNISEYESVDSTSETDELIECNCSFKNGSNCKAHYDFK